MSDNPVTPLDITCEKCGQVLNIGDFPFCPHGRGANSVVGDDIPGGVEIRHGLVHEDGSPMTFYSKKAIQEEAKKRGLVNLVEHVTDPRSGSDKNPYTTRWI